MSKPTLKPALSIVTVTLNNLKSLKETVASIPPHFFDNFPAELVIIDGASTDGTAEFLQELKSQKSIRSISEKDSGIYDAMNKGIQAAQGDYLLFLNAGDLFHPNFKIDLLFQRLGKADFIYADVVLDFDSYKVLRRYPSILDFQFFSREYLCHQSCLVKKTLLQKLGGYRLQYKIAADFDFNIRAYSSGATFEYFPHAFSIFKMDGVSSSGRNTLTTLKEFDNIRESSFLWPWGLLQKKLLNLEHLILSVSSRPLKVVLKLLLWSWLKPLTQSIPPTDFYFEGSTSTQKNLCVRHYSSRDQLGGAAKAATRLHTALMKIGVPSQLRLLLKEGSSSGLQLIETRGPWSLLFTNLGLRLEVLLKHLYRRLLGTSSSTPLSTGYLSFINMPFEQRLPRADIHHLHYIQESMFSIEDIQKISGHIVWTLHDLWPLNALEHLKEKRAENSPLKKYFLSRKKKLHSLKSRCVLVAPSSWIVDEVKKSPHFSDFRVQVIPHEVDEEKFSPASEEERVLVKKSYGLSAHEKVVGFGGVDLRDPNKGFDLLAETLKKLIHLDPTFQFLCFGHGGDQLRELIKVPLTILPFQKNEKDLCRIYQAMDVFIHPSRLETFGLTALESLASGTPVLSFDTTGLRDVVPLDNGGRRVRCFDCGQLAEFTLELLNKNERAGARSHALKFKSGSSAKAYLELYRREFSLK